MEEKGKRSQFRTGVGMDFDLKTTRLHCQEVDEYLAKYGIRLSYGIKVKFCPQGTLKFAHLPQ